MARFEHPVIDPIDDRRIDIITARGRDHDLVRPSLQVLARLGLAGEQAGALEHRVHAETAPRQLGRIALREHLDAIAVDHHRIAIDLDLAGEAAMDRVVARQMRIDFCIAQIIEGNHLQLRALAALVQRAQHIAADAAIAVDPDFQCHLPSPPIDSCIARST